MANEFREIGRDIRNAVLNAVDSGDFSQLNSQITRSVSDAIAEVNSRLQAHGRGGWAPDYRYSPSQNPDPIFSHPPMKKASAACDRQTMLYTKRAKGHVAGLVCTILGAILLGIFGIGLASSILAFSFRGSFGLGFFLSSGVLGALTLGSAVLLIAGLMLMGRSRRFRRYVSALQGKAYCAISKLAAVSRRSERYVLRDLKKMIALGMFPQGRIDDEGKTLLLTDEIYQQYLDLKRRREEQAARAPETEEEKKFREVVERGEQYLSSIRRANDAIPGEAVSQKLYRLEEIVWKIFDQVKKHPEQIPELRRFLDYYMPLTLKLVETYQELDQQQSAGENILSAKTEIEKTLDTVSYAFENLFDSLFEHTAVDISSDISVLKSMLRQEGLTEQDFS